MLIHTFFINLWGVPCYGQGMNKRSWITIVLNGELANEIVYSLIDNSYNLSAKSSR